MSMRNARAHTLVAAWLGKPTSPTTVPRLARNAGLLTSANAMALALAMSLVFAECILALQVGQKGIYS